METKLDISSLLADKSLMACRYIVAELYISTICYYDLVLK